MYINKIIKCYHNNTLVLITFYRKYVKYDEAN